MGQPTIPMKNAFEQLRLTVGEQIAQLRSMAEEPFLLPVSGGLDIELRPSNEDQRVSICKRGQGYTCVNYTNEGLILDVFPNEDLEPVHTASIYATDLAWGHAQEHGAEEVQEIFEGHMTLWEQGRVDFEFSLPPNSTAQAKDAAAFAALCQHVAADYHSVGRTNKVTAQPPTKADLVEKIKAEVERLMAEGKIPPTVRSFSDLHDHCDANCLGGLCDDEMVDAMIAQHGGRDDNDGMPSSLMALINEAQEEVGQWLSEKRDNTVFPIRIGVFCRDTMGAADIRIYALACLGKDIDSGTHYGKAISLAEEDGYSDCAAFDSLDPAWIRLATN